MSDKFVGGNFSKSGSIGSLFAYGSETSKFELDLPFAVIDLETSGLSANSSRVIEIAILRMTVDGKIQDEFSTLINPEDGNVGATYLHQITSEMVRDAPTFGDIKGQILNRLANVIVVAHNAKFEENFLYAEFTRSRTRVPVLPTLDTLQLAPKLVRLPNYKMDSLIDHYGISTTDQHTALGDVRAISKFLPQMIRASAHIKYPVEPGRMPSVNSQSRLKPRITDSHLQN